MGKISPGMTDTLHSAREAAKDLPTTAPTTASLPATHAWLAGAADPGSSWPQRLLEAVVGVFHDFPGRLQSAVHAREGWGGT